MPLIFYFRFEPEHVENIAGVDWNSLQIVETHDEEGRIALISENQMCELLGVREKEHIIVPTEVFDRRMDEHGDYDGAAIPTSDTVPSEVVISYDKNNPPMDVGTIYPTMEEFKMAVRQYAINKEFDLGTGKSDKTRYKCFCKSSGVCPWKINGTKHKGQSTVEVSTLICFD